MSATTAPTVVVTAVTPETRAVLDLLRNVRRMTAAGFRAWEGETNRGRLRVVQSGIGPERAGRALAAVAASSGIVLCVGFAGALGDGVPGDVVLPTRVLWDDGTGTRTYAVPQEIWDVAKRALGDRRSGRVLHGPLWSSATVLASPQDKRRAHERTGAIAVEMETAGLIPIANAQGAAVLPLRIILDSADVSLEGLPPDLEDGWVARFRLMGRPRAWPSVWAVARHVPLATAELRDALRVVLAAL